MIVKNKRVQVVLVPKRKEYDDSNVYLPYVQTIQGLLYFVDPAVRNAQGCILEDLIPSLQKEFTDVLNRPCAIDAESACLYFVGDDDTVYEVGMISINQRFLLVLLPNGEYGDLLYIAGAIFCPEIFCSEKGGML